MQIIKTQTTMTNLKIWLFISYKVNYDGLYIFIFYQIFPHSCSNYQCQFIRNHEQASE